MALLNLCLALQVLGANERAESGYAFFSMTNFGVMSMMFGIGLCLFCLCWLSASIIAPRNRPARIAWIDGIVHAGILALMTIYTLRDPLTSARMLGHAALSPPVNLSLAIGLFVVCLSPIFRRLPATLLHGFFAFALMGAMIVAVGQVSRDRVSGTVATGDTSVTRRASDAGADPQPLPNVYYFVLDGHSGLPAFPDDIPGATAVRDRLRSNYLRRGFELRELAFSNYTATSRSLYTIFDNGIRRPPPQLKMDVSLLPENRLFDEVMGRGYSSVLYYSDFYRMCDAAVDYSPRCEMYPVHNVHFPLPAGQKYPLLLGSIMYRLVGGDLWKQKKRLFGVANAAGTFEQLIADIPNRRQNHFVLAHIMLPHEPYVMTEACRIRDEDVRSLEFVRYYEGANRALAPVKWANYLTQIQCVDSLVEKLVQALRDEGIYEESTIIIHGDHGSRISLLGRSRPSRWAPRLSRQDFLDFYATFFAVKRGALPLAPAAAAGRDHWASVTDILAGLMGWETLEATAFPYRKKGVSQLQLPAQFEPPRASE